LHTVLQVVLALLPYTNKPLEIDLQEVSLLIVRWLGLKALPWFIEGRFNKYY